MPAEKIKNGKKIILEFVHLTSSFDFLLYRNIHLIAQKELWKVA
jgi:hypothetical protein